MNLVIQLYSLLLRAFCFNFSLHFSDRGFNLFFFAQVVIFFISSGLIIAAHLAFKQLSDVQAITYIIGRRSLYESPSTEILPQLNEELIRKLKLV
jgi:hypothetical protein